MVWVKEKERLALEEEGELVGEVLFPKIEGKIQITHTFVSEAYRGQGIAEKLLNALVEELRARQETATPVCSYSLAYRQKHPEAQDVLVP
jgi:predicted GNAT family acetyltransferase